MSELRFDALYDVASIPTSPSDILLTGTPVGPVKTYGSLLQLLAREPKLAFAAVIVGRRFGEYGTSARYACLRYRASFF